MSHRQRQYKCNTLYANLPAGIPVFGTKNDRKWLFCIPTKFTYAISMIFSMQNRRLKFWWNPVMILLDVIIIQRVNESKKIYMVWMFDWTRHDIKKRTPSTLDWYALQLVTTELALRIVSIKKLLKTETHTQKKNRF